MNINCIIENISKESFEYIEQGLYDTYFFKETDRMHFSDYCTISLPTCFEIYKYISGFLYKSSYPELEKNMPFSDVVIIVCAFCKFVSYDSFFESFYQIYDADMLYGYLRRIFSSEYFVSYKFNDDSNTVRTIYALSDLGIERACQLIPSNLLPVNYISKTNKGFNEKYIAHDYFCGTNFLKILLMNYMEMYRREVVFGKNGVQNSGNLKKRSNWAYTTDDTVRTDALAYFESDVDVPNSLFYIEEDTGSENPEIVLSKISVYYAYSFIGYDPYHVLLFSYRCKMENYIDEYFPYVFVPAYCKRVLSLMEYYNCDLFSLICHFSGFDTKDFDISNFKDAGERRMTILKECLKLNQMEDQGMVGDISLSELKAACHDEDAVDYECLYKTALCSLSIFRLFSSAGINNVYVMNYLRRINHRFDPLTIYEYNDLISDTKERFFNLSIDKEMVQDFVNHAMNPACYNPYRIFLKEQHMYDCCRRRRNVLFKRIMLPFKDGCKTPAISDYHIAMAAGADAFFVPSTHLTYYAASVFSPQTYTSEYMCSILEQYYPDIEYAGDCGKPFASASGYPDLYMCNYYTYNFIDDSGFYGEKGKRYSGEVYVEHISASLGGLFRVKMFLEKYCGLSYGGRHVTIVCVVDSYNEAVNMALFLNYWKYVESASDSQPCIVGHSVELCFCTYSALYSALLPKKYLFHVGLRSDSADDEPVTVPGENMDDASSATDNLRDDIFIPSFITDLHSMQNVKGKQTDEDMDMDSEPASGQTMNGYGYCSRLGIFHSEFDFSCKGFFRNNIYNIAVEKDKQMEREWLMRKKQKEAERKNRADAEKEDLKPNVLDNGADASLEYAEGYKLDFEKLVEDDDEY